MEGERISTRGNKLEWVKSLFTCVLQDVPVVTDNSDVSATSDAFTLEETKMWNSWSDNNEIEMGNSKQMKKWKKLKSKVEQNERTIWKCKQCGVVIGPLPKHNFNNVGGKSSKNRTDFQLLMDHIEKECKVKNTNFRNQGMKRSRNINEGDDTFGSSTVIQAEDDEMKRALREIIRSQLNTEHSEAWIAVENPKNPSNLGSILRAMSCFGFGNADHKSENVLIFSGKRITQALKHRGRNGVAIAEEGGESLVSLKGIPTDTHNAAEFINQISLSKMQILFDVVSEINLDTKNSDNEYLSERQVHIVAVDLIKGAESLPFFIHPDMREGERSKLIIYLFGAEDRSISLTYLQQCHSAVYIPTRQSMNLAATVHVILYDRTSKMLTFGGKKKCQTEPEERAVWDNRNANNYLTWK